MTENAGVFVQKQESAGKNWLVVGTCSWPSQGEGCDQTATSLRKLPAHHPYCPSGVVGGGSLQTRD